VNGEKQDNFDIYVQLVGGVERLRLTSDPRADRLPRLVSGRPAHRIFPAFV